MTLLTIFASSFVIALSGAMMPGPLLTVTITESSRRGGMTGPLMIIGHGLLELTLVVALFSGLSVLLHSDQVFITVSLLGGSVLLWMATSMLRSLQTVELPQVESDDTGRNLILTGILLSLCNPYWLLWWVSIGMGYILHSARIGLTGIVAFLCGHLLADLAWYSLISFGVARGRGLFTPRLYRVLIGLCGVVLLGFSGYFFYSGLDRMI